MVGDGLSQYIGAAMIPTWPTSVAWPPPGTLPCLVDSNSTRTEPSWLSA